MRAEILHHLPYARNIVVRTAHESAQALPRILPQHAQAREARGKPRKDSILGLPFGIQRLERHIEVEVVL